MKIVVRVCVIAAVIVLAVLWFRRLDARALVDAMTSANAGWLFLCGAANLPLVWLKARRMHLLLDGKMATPRLMSAYAASYAADNLVMSQAGLGVRVASFRLHGVPLSTAAALQIVEKALEGLGLGLVAGPVLFLHATPAWLRAPVAACVIVAGFALVAAAVLLRRLDSPRAQRFGDAVRMLGRPRVAVEVAALTIAVWLVEASMVMTALRAFSIDVPLLAASALVLLAVNMAALVPALPAGVGTFEVAATVALRALGVPTEVALPMALVFHALHTIPVTIAGLIAQPRALRRSNIPT